MGEVIPFPQHPPEPPANWDLICEILEAHDLDPATVTAEEIEVLAEKLRNPEEIELSALFIRSKRMSE